MDNMMICCTGLKIVGAGKVKFTELLTSHLLPLNHHSLLSTLLKLPPARQGSSWGPMERTACLYLAWWRFPTLSQPFPWYSRTWSAKELDHWLLLAKPTLCQYHFSRLNACLTITSDLAEPCSSWPPTTLILPPTTEARTELNALGREARGVQSVASERRV